MPQRDPKTGKFVSGGGSMDWSDTTQIGAYVSYSIPAADLAGGTGVTGAEQHESTELVNFSPMLANDEVFVLHAARVTAGLALPTTATAESSGGMSFVIGTEPSGQLHSVRSPFYHGSSDGGDGIIDYSKASKETGGVWHRGQAYAEASHSDTVNAVSAGSAPANQTEMVVFDDIGARPAYDRDDEIYAPAELWYDNISDHAIEATITVLLFGHVEEV